MASSSDRAAEPATAAPEPGPTPDQDAADRLVSRIADAVWDRMREQLPKLIANAVHSELAARDKMVWRCVSKERQINEPSDQTPLMKLLEDVAERVALGMLYID